MSLNEQSLIVKTSLTVTVVIFVGGLINSVLSFLTFQDKEIQKVGCGTYLLASSITSFFTITLFAIKFLFILFTKMNESTNFSGLRVGCISIEFLLKIFVYIDAWLNACVAAERTITVFKGINFDQKKSRRVARWILVLLPLFIILTFIHEPLHRHVLQYQTERYELMEYTHWTNFTSSGNPTKPYDDGSSDLNQSKRAINRTIVHTTEQHTLCTTSYSVAIQDYNTIILFFHLIVPFTINLLSALYIIFGTARQKSTTRSTRKYRRNIFKQLKKHKQPLISSVILLVLSLPRLIISLQPGCVDVSANRWLYLSAYFISFTPSMLVFVVFVLPSELYKRTLKETLARCF